MANRSDFVARALLTMLFSYAIAIGATFNGIFNPEFSPITLGMIALMLGVWLFIRWRQGWKWHRTPLDEVFFLWALAFGLSLLANTDATRRIAIGLWYVSLYIGVWYILQDGLANNAFSRHTLIDALLISGFVIIFFGYLQLQGWLVKALTIGLTALALPR